MPYTAPTATDLRDRFPAFTEVSDAIIDTALADAARVVDDTWLSQGDFTLGRLLYAAHVLTLEGHGTGAEAELAAAGALTFEEMRTGGLSLKRTGAKVASAEMPLTIYALRFREVLRRNVGGPVVGIAP